MIILKATTESIQIVTTTAAAIDYSVTYADIVTTSFTPSTNEGKITTATNTGEPMPRFKRPHRALIAVFGVIIAVAAFAGPASAAQGAAEHAQRAHVRA